MTLDLGGLYEITAVSLYPRNDDDGLSRRAARTLRVLAGAVKGPTSGNVVNRMLDHNTACWTGTQPLPGGGISVPCHAVAQYVTVQQTWNDDPASISFALGNVAIFGQPLYGVLTQIQNASLLALADGSSMCAAPPPPTFAPPGCLSSLGATSMTVACTASETTLTSITGNATYGGCVAPLVTSGCNGLQACTISAIPGPACAAPDTNGFMPCGVAAGLGPCAGPSAMTVCYSCAVGPGLTAANAGDMTPPSPGTPVPIALVTPSPLPSNNGPFCIPAGGQMQVNMPTGAAITWLTSSGAFLVAANGVPVRLATFLNPILPLSTNGTVTFRALLATVCLNPVMLTAAAPVLTPQPAPAVTLSVAGCSTNNRVIDAFSTYSNAVTPSRPWFTFSGDSSIRTLDAAGQWWYLGADAAVTPVNNFYDNYTSWVVSPTAGVPPPSPAPPPVVMSPPPPGPPGPPSPPVHPPSPPPLPVPLPPTYTNIAIQSAANPGLCWGHTALVNGCNYQPLVLVACGGADLFTYKTASNLCILDLTANAYMDTWQGLDTVNQNVYSGRGNCVRGSIHTTRVFLFLILTTK